MNTLQHLKMDPLHRKHEGIALKIAFMEKDLSPRSGSRRFIYEVTRNLNARGHDVRCFTLKLDKKTCFPELLSIPIEVVPIDEFRSIPSRFLKKAIGRDVDYLWLENRAILGISRKVSEWNPDAAVFHYAGGVWVQPYFYNLKKPLGIVCLHVTPPIKGPLALPFQNLTMRGRIRRVLYQFPPMKNWRAVSTRNIGFIVAHSRYLLTQAVKQGVVGSRRSAIIPLAVNHSEFYPTGEEEPFALYLGRIHPHKTLELAVKSMEKAPSDKSLIIAGDLEPENLWYKTRLERIAERIKISDRFKVVVSPTTEEVVRLMQRCAVFLFPSTIDTFGLVVLEAMACGKPVVACNRGGAPELLEGCGFLLEPSIAQWQNGVKKLLSDNDLRLETGRKAFERSKLYSWENTANSLLHVLEDFLASKDECNS